MGPLVMDPLVERDPLFRVKVPSVNVAPNTNVVAETLAAEEMTPLVREPAVDMDP